MYNLRYIRIPQISLPDYSQMPKQLETHILTECRDHLHFDFIHKYKNLTSEVKRLENLRGQFNLSIKNKIFPLLLSGKSDEAKALFMGEQHSIYIDMGGVSKNVTKTAYKYAYKQIYIAFLFFSGALFITFVFSFFSVRFLSKSIADPLVEITKVSDQISAGNLDANFTDLNRQDEIGRLAQSFSFMINSIKKLILDEAAVSDDKRVDGFSLEEMVKERTIQLQNELEERKKINNYLTIWFNI